MRPPKLTGDTALFLDFDGVLSEIVDDPDAARLTDERAAALVALAERLDGAVCLISGRSLPDLADRVPEALWRAGGHGMDTAAPGAAADAVTETPPSLLDRIETVLQDFPGARAEPKGPVVAVHYRATPEAGPALGEALRPAAEAEDGYSLHGGKMVWEFKPAGRDKGRALTRMMEQPPFKGRLPVMVGDDVTDEDGFGAAHALGGLAVKVGEGETRADYRLSSVAEVWDWLAA